MEDERVLERERHQIEQILQLDNEELQVEEVDYLPDSDDDRDPIHGHGGVETFAEFTFNSSLASLHTYLGEVEDSHHRMAFLDGGAILNLPVFYLEGVVLFPEATLPLRVIQANFIAAIERVLTHFDTPNTIGVVHVSLDSDNEKLHFANIGTTAEIRQFRRLEDGSINVLTRGKQRFRLRRRWIDAEGVPCGEVQIIQEDLPLRTPRDAFGELAPRSSVQRHSLSCALASYTSCSRQFTSRDEEVDSASNSEESFERELSLRERKIHQAAIDSNESSSDEEISGSESEHQHAMSHLNDSDSLGSMQSDYEKENEKPAPDTGKSSTSARESSKRKELERCRRNSSFNPMHGVSKAFWPYWVYSMYDSYCLAQKAAAMWKQIVGVPNMDGFVKNPDILSFYIASKIPVSESTRQELLEIDGISYRLRREVELLKSIDIIQCKNCKTVIAKRSDMLVMSSDGPLGAYVNPHGYVHEITTFNRANGIALRGRAATEYSWFPGYAWTISICATCETQLGWLFTATNRNLKPRSFWGIRSSQLADATR
ncbi:protein cereblon isoform X4 [Momordica charantia]|uniref:Protein cereblon n=1 Tax=Momordica charantia TaxID=3673 RepID=A0A6J1BR44_MOMCH|nr:protein cereblon isoform X3 [Momordica charantia]XP_022131734.1 protein cereblon isoform X4 [Momordica charantia]